MTRVGLLYVDDFFQPRSQRVGSLGLASIAAWLEQELPGCEAQIFITAADLLAFEPDMVGISAYSETLPAALEQARLIQQQRDVPLILGGPHMATNPHDLRPEITLGVVGEGEEVMVELVRLQRENALVPARLRQLPGLTFRDQGQLIQTGRCPEFQDLDRLAHPNRRRMFAPLAAHFADFKPLFHVHTARGCPYRCTFCSAPLVNPSWRFHSPEWVVAELEQIARDYPDCDQITFSDDLFTLKPARLEALARAIRASGLHRRFFFLCSSRSNTLTPEICRMLTDMNMLLISFGMESGSDALIRKLKGRGTTRRDYERVLELCQRYGLYAHGNLISGDQHETAADLHATWELLSGQRDRFATAYLTHMTPFPGTAVWDQAVASGRFDPEAVDYRLLNLEFDPARTLLLSPHYSRAFYTQAHQQLKALTEAHSLRFTGESGLIKAALKLEREDIPDQLAHWLAELDWPALCVVSERIPPLPARLGDTVLQVCTPDQLVELPAQMPLLLWHTLGSQREPQRWLQHLTPRPLLSLDFHVGHYYNLILLLLGQWQDGCWGSRDPRQLRQFTRRSLTQLMGVQGWEPQRWQAFTLALELPIEPLRLLRAIATPPEPESFCWLSLWQPQSSLSSPLL